MLQRTKKRNNELGQECIAKLDKIGFDWGKTHSDNDLWNMKYQAFIECKHSMGVGNLRHRFNKEITILKGEFKGAKVTGLANWCIRQRTKKKKNELNQERIAKLDKIKFDWGKNDKIISSHDKWDMKFQALIEYKKKNGGKDPPIKFNNKIIIQSGRFAGDEIEGLGNWVGSQRRNRNNTIELANTGALNKKQNRTVISQQHIDKLNKIGFGWGKLAKKLKG